MSLRDLIAAHPGRFYEQTWYFREAFLDWPRTYPVRLPGFMPQAAVDARDDLPRAVTLAELFLQYPHEPIWSHYLWCADTDALGQRVYVGGVSPTNGHRFEIHRHLHITDRWGVASW